MNEAGKTIQNAIDEIREAVDFLRYYSNQMIDIEETDQKLEGPTGCLLYTSPSPRDYAASRMPSSA